MRNSTFIVLGLLFVIAGVVGLLYTKSRKSKYFNGEPLWTSVAVATLLTWGTIGLLFGLINGRMPAIVDALNLFGIHF